MSLIKLTSTETHEYFAVPVPRDARHIARQRISHGENEGQYSLSYQAQFLDTKGFITKYVDVGVKQQFWILGVIGNGEKISQEIAQEISEATLGIKIIHHPKDKPDYINWLKFKLGEKGILVENPFKKPKYISIGAACVGIEQQRMNEYSKNKAEWQSCESKLVKAVIIKVKK